MNFRNVNIAVLKQQFIQMNEKDFIANAKLIPKADKAYSLFSKEHYFISSMELLDIWCRIFYRKKFLQNKNGFK